MSRVLRIALVGAAFAVLAVAIYSCSALGLGGDKNVSIDPQSSGFSTDLIAGDGRGNGPGNGTDTGDISFSDDGNNLTISIDMDEASDWSLGGLHIYVGDGVPTNGQGKPTVAPGQFPYTAADGTWAVNGDQWEGTFDISQLDSPFTIAVHGTGSLGATLGGFFQPECQGEFASYGLYYGNNDILIGTVTMSIVGNDIQVTVTMDSPWLATETHLYLQPAADDPPPFAPGQWTYGVTPVTNGGVSHGSGVTTYTYTVPLSAFGIDPQDPQALADLTMAFHATVKSGSNGASESSTAWNEGCRTHFEKNNGDPHWKSYTTCADFGPCEWVWVEEGSEGTEETLWAQNDPVTNGWFPDNGFNRWGWFITYEPGQ